VALRPTRDRQAARHAPRLRPEPAVIDAADAVVVGSGAFGSSVAYHWPGTVSGWRCSSAPARLADFTRAAGSPARSARLRRSPRSPGARWSSSPRSRRDEPTAAVHAERRAQDARNDRDAAQLAREVEAVATPEFDRLHLDRRGARDCRSCASAASPPSLSPPTATWSPPSCRSAIAARRRRSGRPCYPTPGHRLRDRPRGVEGVAHAAGHIATRVVVDAAGAWSRLVAESLGGTLQVVPTRHQLLITEPIPGMTPEFRSPA